MKILLPIDGSDCSEKTMQWAAATFDPIRTRFFLLFVIPILPDLNTVEFDIKAAVDFLENAKREMERSGCIVERADYTLGDPAEQIIRFAEEIDADQILIGSHGRTGLSKILMGSISMQVLEHASRPVTVYRNVERRAVIKPASADSAKI